MTRKSALTRLLRVAFAIPILLGLANVAVARNSPIVRVTATPEEVSVGEAIALQVTVLVPTWFPTPLGYPSFELANAITRLPPDSSYPTNERINGETWSGIVRRYQIHPLLGATYRLTGRVMTVTYAHPQSLRPFTVEVDVPDTEFRAVVPAGAEALDPYLAGASLELEREIEGDLRALQTGDALVVRYTALLKGLPAIFLPSLLAGRSNIPGVSAYADEPVIEDAPDGDGQARRSERLTLVFESGGDFTLPGLELDWWNTRTHAIETVSVPAFTVSVAGAVPISAEEVPSAADSSRISLFAIISLALGLALAILSLMRWAPRLRRRWIARQQRRRASEAYAFTCLRSSLRGGDPGAAHRDWLTWLVRLEPGIDARQFAHLYGDAELETQTEQLSRSLYSGAAQSPDLRRLEQSLVAARRAYLRQLADNRPFVLPTLNP